MKVLPTIGGVAMALCLAAPAHADQDDYIGLLDLAGIPYSSRSAAIHLGREVCNALDQGVAFTTTGKTIADSGNYTAYEAGEIIYAAVSGLCPEHMSEVKAQAQAQAGQ